MEQRAANKEAARQANRVNQPPAMKQQQAGRAQLASDLEANKQATVHTCKHCGRNFDKSREGWFHKHESDCPGPVKKVDVQVGASNLIGLLTSAHAEYAEKQGSTVTFTVQSRALLDAELDLQLVDGDLTVMAVRPTCMRANVHALAAPGSVLTEAVHVPTTPAAAQPQSTAHERTPAPAGPARRLSPTDLHEVGFPVQVTLRLPPPPLKARGWATMIPQRKPYKPPQEVEAFLRAEWNKNKKVTAYLLAKKLQEHFPHREELHDLPLDIQKALNRYYTEDRKKNKENQPPE
jgi:hypothetical protein